MSLIMNLVNLCIINHISPNSLLNDFNNEIDRMLDMNIIEPTASQFSFPVVMVQKTGESFDFRALNDASDLDTDPMLTPKRLLEDL